MTVRRVLSLVVVVQSLLIAALVWHGWQRVPRDNAPQSSRAPASHPSADDAAHAGTDGDGPSAAPDHPEAEPGTLRVAPAVQQTSGVVVAAVMRGMRPAPRPVTGQVLSAQGLAETRLHLRQAEAEIDQWTAPLAHARAERARLDALWADGGNVAHRQVEQAEADLAQFEQRVASARRLQESVRETVRAEWGAPLLDALERPDGGVLAGVLAGTDWLLRLPSGAATRGTVQAVDASAAPVAAQRLGPATLSEAGGTLPTWFWRVPTGAAGLRAGQPVLFAAADPAGPAGSGGVVPEAAVVWQAGQPWVYLQIDPARFQRRAIRLLAASGTGWFVGDSLPPGSRIVVQGAQLLLSEESRALIRNENGD